MLQITYPSIFRRCFLMGKKAPYRLARMDIVFIDGRIMPGRREIPGLPSATTILCKLCAVKKASQWAVCSCWEMQTQPLAANQID